MSAFGSSESAKEKWSLKSDSEVLRIGGRICVVSLSKMGGPSRMRRLYGWGHRVFPGILDCRPIYVERALREAGFAINDATIGSVAGLPVEVVLATKPGQ